MCLAFRKSKVNCTMVSNKNDFKIVSLRYAKDTESHSLFIKEQRLNRDSAQKSFFVANLPPYVDENVLKSSCSNQIISLELISNQNSEIGFRNASVVCKNHSKVFNSPVFSCELPSNGIKKWINCYNDSKPDIELISKQINKYALHYKQQEGKKSGNMDSKDEEGWTVVKKKGSKTTELGKVVKNKAKKKDTKNFYAFQIRENNLKKLIDLRMSFEEAKKRVNLIKSSRKFKP